MTNPAVEAAIVHAALDRGLLSNEDIEAAALVAIGMSSWVEGDEVVVKRDDLEAVVSWIEVLVISPGPRTRALREALDG